MITKASTTASHRPLVAQSSSQATAAKSSSATAVDTKAQELKTAGAAPQQIDAFKNGATQSSSTVKFQTTGLAGLYESAAARYSVAPSASQSKAALQSKIEIVQSQLGSLPPISEADGKIVHTLLGNVQAMASGQPTGSSTIAGQDFHRKSPTGTREPNQEQEAKAGKGTSAQPADARAQLEDRRIGRDMPSLGDRSAESSGTQDPKTRADEQKKLGEQVWDDTYGGVNEPGAPKDVIAALTDGKAVVTSPATRTRSDVAGYVQPSAGDSAIANSGAPNLGMPGVAAGVSDLQVAGGVGAAGGLIANFASAGAAGKGAVALAIAGAEGATAGVAAAGGGGVVGTASGAIGGAVGAGAAPAAALAGVLLATGAVAYAATRIVDEGLLGGALGSMFVPSPNATTAEELAIAEQATTAAAENRAKMKAEEEAKAKAEAEAKAKAEAEAKAKAEEEARKSQEQNNNAGGGAGDYAQDYVRPDQMVNWVNYKRQTFHLGSHGRPNMGGDAINPSPDGGGGVRLPGNGTPTGPQDKGFGGISQPVSGEDSSSKKPSREELREKNKPGDPTRQGGVTDPGRDGSNAGLAPTGPGGNPEDVDFNGPGDVSHLGPSAGSSSSANAPTYKGPTRKVYHPIT